MYLRHEKPLTGIEWYLSVQALDMCLDTEGTSGNQLTDENNTQYQHHGSAPVINLHFIGFFERKAKDVLKYSSGNMRL